MKILYVATISNTLNAFMIPHIELLLEQGHQVDIACNVNREINPNIIKRGCKVYDIEFQRSPIDKRNYLAYKKLKKLVINERYDIVHTHTPIASTCVRLACKNQRGIRVLYTAHGFHFFKGAPLKNWLLYYPIERYLAKYTNVIITINKEDYERARKSFKAKNVEYIPGVGFNLQKFSSVKINEFEKREEIGIPNSASILLSVGELNKNKNHETIIRAIAKLNDPNIYYIICGEGPLINYLKDSTKKLGIDNQVKLLGIRRDIAELCKLSDIFVFPSYREGLSVALMEAMASKLPIVSSNIRGNRDLVEDKKGGFLVKPNDIGEFARHLEIVLSSIEMRTSMGNHNYEAIKNFDLDKVNKRLREIYSNV